MSSNKDYNLNATLAFEERPNSFVLIDLSLLDIMKSYNIEQSALTLESLDSILCNFTEAELRNAIKQSNIVKAEYLSAPLVIYYKNHSLPVITRDNINEVTNLDISINSCCNNKQDANKYINKYISVYKKYYSSTDEMISNIQETLKKAFYNRQTEYIKATFAQLPYEGQREMAFYYYNLNKEQARIAKLEKKKD